MSKDYCWRCGEDVVVDKDTAICEEIIDEKWCVTYLCKKCEKEALEETWIRKR